MSLPQKAETYGDVMSLLVLKSSTLFYKHVFSEDDMVYETSFYLPKVCLSDAGGASMDSVQTPWTGGDLTDSLLGCLRKDTLVFFLPSTFSDIIAGKTCGTAAPFLVVGPPTPFAKGWGWCCWLAMSTLC